MSMTEFGITDHFSPLKHAFLRAPARTHSPSVEWQSWGYMRARDGEKALAQHQAFVKALEEAGVEVHLLPPSADEEVDGCYACTFTFYESPTVWITRMIPCDLLLSLLFVCGV